jgi:hypothetical protein
MAPEVAAGDFRKSEVARTKSCQENGGSGEFSVTRPKNGGRSEWGPVQRSWAIMVKKLVLGAVAAAVLGVFVFGRDVGSYVRTGAASVRQAVKREVPIEFEIERARHLVARLVPDVRHCMHVVAEQQVEVEQLEQQIARRESELATQKDKLMTLRNELDSGKSAFVFAGKTYSSADVVHDVSIRFERFKAADELLTADRRILAARQQHLTANQEKLQGLMQSKKDLEVRLEQLAARLQTIRAAETVSTVAFDDSQLSRAKELINQLNRQLDVKQKVLDAEGRLTALIPMEDSSVDVGPTAEAVTAQIDAYFQPPADAAAVVQAP